VQPGDFLAICGTAGAAWRSPGWIPDCVSYMLYPGLYIYIIERYNPFPLLLNGPPPNNKHLEEFLVFGVRLVKGDGDYSQFCGYLPV